MYLKFKPVLLPGRSNTCSKLDIRDLHHNGTFSEQLTYHVSTRQWKWIWCRFLSSCRTHLTYPLWHSFRGSILCKLPYGFNVKVLKITYTDPSYVSVNCYGPKTSSCLDWSQTCEVSSFQRVDVDSGVRIYCTVYRIHIPTFRRILPPSFSKSDRSSKNNPDQLIL